METTEQFIKLGNSCSDQILLVKLFKSVKQMSGIVAIMTATHSYVESNTSIPINASKN